MPEMQMRRAQPRIIELDVLVFRIEAVPLFEFGQGGFRLAALKEDLSERQRRGAVVAARGVLAHQGLLPGRVVRFANGLKVPHMGWNQVRIVKQHPIFEGVGDGSYFYFVHSYYPRPADPEIVIGETEYGVNFASVIARDNIVATQFHPEKSGEAGLRMYANFLKIAATAGVA